jgi:hypothetical protein
MAKFSDAHRRVLIEECGTERARGRNESEVIHEIAEREGLQVQTLRNYMKLAIKAQRKRFQVKRSAFLAKQMARLDEAIRLAFARHKNVDVWEEREGLDKPLRVTKEVHDPDVRAAVVAIAEQNRLTGAYPGTDDKEVRLRLDALFARIVSLMRAHLHTREARIRFLEDFRSMVQQEIQSSGDPLPQLTEAAVTVKQDPKREPDNGDAEESGRRSE